MGYAEGESVVRSGTLSCRGAGGQDGQQALSLQVEEMLLLHLEELLLDGDLLGRQLSRRSRKKKNHHLSIYLCSVLI